MTGKRASGESSIYQDDEGRWHGYVSMGLKSGGRRDRRHVSGAKRADVVTKVRALERKRDAGMIEASGRPITVEQWLTHWQDTIAEPKVRPSTLVRYKQLIKHQIIPGIGHHRLDRLQPEHVEAMYAELLVTDESRWPYLGFRDRVLPMGKPLLNGDRATGCLDHAGITLALKRTDLRHNIGALGTGDVTAITTATRFQTHADVSVPAPLVVLVNRALARRSLACH